jgi:lysophospholipase L1-like esterase
MFTSCNSTDVEVVEPEIIEEIVLEETFDIQIEEVLEEPVPNSQNDEYFNSSLFVGDSIMEGIRQYVARVRKEETLLGDARFVTTTVGISVADLTGDRDEGIYFSYRGEEMPISDIIGEVDANRVFFLVGLNDLAAGFDNETTVERYVRLINTLKAEFTDTEFIVITNPPKVESQWLPGYVKNKGFNNELILDFVTRLKSLCEENGIEFVDIHTPLSNENGALDNDNCRDGYVHLNDNGSKIVVDALYKFAEFR